MSTEPLQESEQPEKPKRKRIIIGGIPPNAVPAIIDDTLFIANLCTDAARNVGLAFGEYEISLWHHKHYHNRLHLGEDDGSKRNGIDSHIVEDIVERSLKQLFHYSGMFTSFKFINFPHQADKIHKVVLKELQDSGEMLNVVIEAHLLGLANYQITIVTAKCHDNFKMGLGQYAIELQGDTSVLRRLVNNKLEEIYSI